jgi:DNA-binding CsgD family transcriptional regulator
MAMPSTLWRLQLRWARDDLWMRSISFARELTNSEIAKHLVLSTRTVETHIYRAMRKLGVKNRRDFRAR